MKPLHEISTLTDEESDARAVEARARIRRVFAATCGDVSNGRTWQPDAEGADWPKLQSIGKDDQH